MDRVVAAHHLGDENQGGALDTPFNPIDNPDARICQDVRSFTKLFVSAREELSTFCLIVSLAAVSLAPDYLS